MTESTSGGLLREVARLYTRAQRVVADCCRTTSTQCHLLTELGRSGPLPLSELGTRVSLEKSWVSRAVEAMAARGLVSKEPNPLDARSWLVTLTADGERTVRELNQTLDDHAQQLLASLSERERAAVETSLLTLLKALREDPAATCCLPPQAQREPTQDSKSCC
jgi:DNA-binding MarR family transcriptional regulator